PAGSVVPTGKGNGIVSTGRLEDLSRAGPTNVPLDGIVKFTYCRSSGGIEWRWHLYYGDGGGLEILGGSSFKEDNWDCLDSSWWRDCESKGDEMSIKSVLGIFLGGFWVEELALEAIEYGDQRIG
ncbi:hypothetical protein Tco_1035967, partial [Tanacetum coccineum]